MSTQIPLAELLQQQPNLPATADPAPASPLADIDDETLARIYFHHTKAGQQSLSPDHQIKFAALGLGALAMVGAIFTAWLYRPVQSMAQAEMMRELSSALVQQQQQVEQAIATANPPQYKCNALIGGCHFPEASGTQLTAAQLNQIIQAAQQQPAQPATVVTSY